VDIFDLGIHVLAALELGGFPLAFCHVKTPSSAFAGFVYLLDLLAAP
jgi:hypothetical protein